MFPPQVCHHFLCIAVPQYHDSKESRLHHWRNLDLLHRLWNRLHHLLWDHPCHHLPGVHVLCHAANNGLTLQSHVHAGPLPCEEDSRTARLQLHPPASQHEGCHHAHHPPWHLYCLLGSLLPSPDPDEILPSQSLLCVLYVPLQHVPYPHYVQCCDWPTDLRLQESGDEEDF